MANLKKTPPHILTAQLNLLKHNLLTPKTKIQIASEIKIPNLQFKLVDWVKSGDIFMQARVENRRRHIYYGLKPFEVDYIPSVREVERLKPSEDAPSDKWVEQNGNSRIIRPTLNANYGHQMSLYRKTKQEVWVASSLSSF